MNTDHKTKVVTRIPPSPTGHFHIGTARTALFNYLFAKQQGGEFVYRSEDTDAARSDIAYETEIQDGLHWLGITWDNDIVRQSERGAIYQSYLEKLLTEDKAYISEEPSKKDPTQTVSLVRLRNPNTTITFTDLVRGDISFDTTELGDFIIARATTDALYHFTVVVDDHEMGVTHVLRGEDHISNTPRQILIQEALGFSRPTYAHLPLILAPDRSKMSKRNGAVAIHEYQDMGILPTALINYLALLGWNPGTNQEFFTLNDLIDAFSINQIQKGGAIFDLEKLKWLNKLHLEQLAHVYQVTYVLDACHEAADLEDTDRERLERLVPTILERYHSKHDIRDSFKAGEHEYVVSRPNIDLSMLAWKKDPDVQAVLPRLKYVHNALQTADFSSIAAIKSALWTYAEETGKGEVLWPLRVALTGQERSPDPFTVAYALGQEETLSRIAAACDKIEGK